MTREAGKFDEAFGVEVIRKAPAAIVPEMTSIALTAEDLGAMVCVIKAVRIGTGEEIAVVMTAQDWQTLIDQHGLVVTRSAQ